MKYLSYDHFKKMVCFNAGLCKEPLQSCSVKQVSFPVFKNQGKWPRCFHAKSHQAHTQKLLPISLMKPSAATVHTLAEMHYETSCDFPACLPSSLPYHYISVLRSLSKAVQNVSPIRPAA